MQCKVLQHVIVRAFIFLYNFQHGPNHIMEKKEISFNRALFMMSDEEFNIISQDFDSGRVDTNQLAYLEWRKLSSTLPH